MRITKCDLCKKRIKEKPITAGVGYFLNVELCEKCGLPILKFLKKNKFIEDIKDNKRKTS